MTTAAARPQLQYLHDALEDLKSKHLYFRMKVLEGEQKPVAIFDGKEVINLSSNNYLGLTTHPKLRRAAIEATGNSASAPAPFAPSPEPWKCTWSSKSKSPDSSIRSLRRVSVRLHRERRHRLRDSRQRRSHHFRRVEPCLHHRRLPPLQSHHQSFQTQRRRRLRARPARKPKTGTAKNSSSPTAFSPWRATSPRFPLSATSRKNTIAS